MTTVEMMEEWSWRVPLRGGGVASGLGAMFGGGSLELRKKMPPAGA
jgi:hypothetical protein